ncbi:hypothetical protein D3C72_1478710 [compost metagenome]
MVLPFMAVRTSPGRMALASGMFSARAATAATSTGAPALARARTAPTTLAAPDMSIFILPMLAPGLIEMPPESKVMPLPRRATGPASGAP